MLAETGDLELARMYISYGRIAQTRKEMIAEEGGIG